MSTEELMKPRYRVIADYPGTPFKVGEILYIFETVDECEEFDTRTGHTPRLNSFSQWEKYPSLFRKLEWWEEREEKDMPEYVRVISTQPGLGIVKDEVIGVNKWEGRYLSQGVGKGACIDASFVTPATKTEYNEHLKSKQII